MLYWYKLQTVTSAYNSSKSNYETIDEEEISIYRPSDLWTLARSNLLKWWPSVRDRCYHAISRYLSARPHEILNLKIRDIVLKQVRSKQYAEVLVSGKTETRHILLIDSLAYVKGWLDQHPQRTNKDAHLSAQRTGALLGVN
jgi:integrase/recombinase XerD